MTAISSTSCFGLSETLRDQRSLLLEGVEAGVISQSNTSAQGTPGYRGAHIPSPSNRQARGCHGDRLATPTAWLNCCLRPHPGKMLRGGCKASERRRHLIDRLSWQQDQALSSSIYLLREMGPTAFLLREEEPENRDFRVTTAPNLPRLPARRTRPVPPRPTLYVATRCRTSPASVPDFKDVRIAEQNSIC